MITNTHSPQLTQAASPEEMLLAFRTYFQVRYPYWKGQIVACFIDQIRHKPGKKCRFLYRLRLQEPERAYDQWFVGTMALGRGGGRAGKRPFTTNGHKTRPGGWLPNDHWPEMNMKLTAFPHDGRLPALKTLLDPTKVQEIAQNQAAAFGLAPNWRCETVTVHQAKYMPFKRCVLRYEFTWVSPVGTKKHHTVYSKTYKDDSSGYVYNAINLLWQAALETQGELHIPQPLCHLAEFNTVWQAAWSGNPLGQTVADGSWQAYLPAIARGLAQIHLLEMDDPDFHLKPMPSIADMLENSRGDLADIEAFFDDPQEQTLQELTQVMARLTDEADFDTATIPQTPVHGTFKMAQILVNGTEIAIVDFDSVAQGDPLYDVAEFIASIIALRSKNGLSADEVSQGVQSFIAAYAESVPWACDPSRINWYTTNFLLSKIHSMLKGIKTRDETYLQEMLEITDWRLD